MGIPPKERLLGKSKIAHYASSLEPDRNLL